MLCKLVQVAQQRLVAHLALMVIFHSFLISFLLVVVLAVLKLRLFVMVFQVVQVVAVVPQAVATVQVAQQQLFQFKAMQVETGFMVVLITLVAVVAVLVQQVVTQAL